MYDLFHDKLSLLGSHSLSSSKLPVKGCPPHLSLFGPGSDSEVAATLGRKLTIGGAWGEEMFSMDFGAANLI